MLDNDRAAAFDELGGLLRRHLWQRARRYAIPPGALTDTTKQREMATFFWWTAWAASTNRPGQDVTYTQNWPHEELIGNRPTGGPWYGASSASCCCWRAVGGMVWYFASQDHEPSTGIVPRRDPLLGCIPHLRRKPRSSTFLWWLRCGWSRSRWARSSPIMASKATASTEFR